MGNQPIRNTLGPARKPGNTANPQADYLLYLMSQGLLPPRPGVAVNPNTQPMPQGGAAASGGPSTGLGAPAPYTRHGDTIGSVNAQGYPHVARPLGPAPMPTTTTTNRTPMPPGWDVPVTQKRNDDPLGRTFSPRLPGSQTDPMLELLERWLASKFSRTSGVL
jgi:hypothetical protein